MQSTQRLCKVYGSPRAMQVGPTRGITVITTPGASAAAVMPGVQRTPGQPRGREARGVKARGAMERMPHVPGPGARCQVPGAYYLLFWRDTASYVLYGIFIYYVFYLYFVLFYPGHDALPCKVSIPGV